MLIYTTYLFIKIMTNCFTGPSVKDLKRTRDNMDSAIATCFTRATKARDAFSISQIIQCLKICIP